MSLPFTFKECDGPEDDDWWTYRNVIFTEDFGPIKKNEKFYMISVSLNDYSCIHAYRDEGQKDCVTAYLDYNLEYREKSRWND